jgi:hypothetical protein
MSDDNPYPRLFLCGNPSCQKVLGIKDRDGQRAIWLYVLRNGRAKGTQLKDLALVRSEFSMIHVGFGDVPCTCGHNTRWLMSKSVLRRILARYKYEGIRIDV